MSLFVDLHFGAILNRNEIAFIRDLPDWPTVQKVTAGDRPLVWRLKRLGCIQIEKAKDDPIQIWFDVYAGVTAAGRTAAESGVVRLS